MLYSAHSLKNTLSQELRVEKLQKKVYFDLDKILSVKNNVREFIH
jgi:hypothetical protein